jgi:hypothetical protein
MCGFHPSENGGCDDPLAQIIKRLTENHLGIARHVRRRGDNALLSASDLRSGAASAHSHTHSATQPDHLRSRAAAVNDADATQDAGHLRSTATTARHANSDQVTDHLRSATATAHQHTRDCHAGDPTPLSTSQFAND